MRLAPTPHGASRLVQAIPARSVKTRRAPSRHCRDVKVYGHIRLRPCMILRSIEYTTPRHPYARKLASKAVLSRMQLTLHATHRTPHGASRLVLAMSAWSVKTQRAQSLHCRDARVYRHTTTAMHENEYPPSPIPYRLPHNRKNI